MNIQPNAPLNPFKAPEYPPPNNKRKRAEKPGQELKSQPNKLFKQIVQSTDDEEKLPKSRFKRSYPPISGIDTIYCKTPGGKFLSAHGKALCFQDDDIVEIRAKSLPPKAIFKTQSGRTVLQQQAVRGCTAACSEMLKADRGLPIDWEHMASTNLGNTENIVRTLKNSKLVPIVTENVQFDQLEKMIATRGSAIVDVDAGAGGHVIVLDTVYPQANFADIRDPYHGWAIRVKLTALKKATGNSTTIIQITK